MLVTTAEMREWIGRRAMDPYGMPVGEVSAVFSASHSGAPEWLLLTEQGAEEGRLVPLAGAVPTGRQIRVVPTADRIGAAPHARVGAEVDPDTNARTAEHYGLALDSDGSPTAIVSDPGAPHPQQPSPRSHPPRPSQKVIEGLHAAHAMEQASLKLLNAARRRSRDEEMVHDIALHHKATDDHAERIRVRLDELDASRARSLDWPAMLLAYVEAQRGRLRSTPELADLAEAMRFEEAEMDAYRELRDLAQQAGDEATAELCDANLADEEAMLMTLRNFRLRADPGFRRGLDSPFETPPGLAELAPES
jgi:ferritin-like metal-binding protein YciE